MGDKREVRHSSRGRRLTADEAARYRAARSEIDREKPTISARIRDYLKQFRRLSEVFDALRSAREAQGLSLTDIQERTGIDRSTLCKLENGQRENFTLETISRYAQAVGKEVLFKLADAK